MKIYMIYDYSNMHADVIEEQDFNDFILSDFEREAIQNLKVGSCYILGGLGQIDYMITRVN